MILISNVFSPQKNNPVIQEESLKVDGEYVFFSAGKQVVKRAHFLIDFAVKYIYSTQVPFLTPRSKVVVGWK